MATPAAPAGAGENPYGLMAALEQRPSDEPFQRLHASAKCRRRQSKLLGSGLDRTQSGNLHERFDGGEGRQSSHAFSCSQNRLNVHAKMRDFCSSKCAFRAVPHSDHRQSNF